MKWIQSFHHTQILYNFASLILCCFVVSRGLLVGAHTFESALYHLTALSDSSIKDDLAAISLKLESMKSDFSPQSQSHSLVEMFLLSSITSHYSYDVDFKSSDCMNDLQFIADQLLIRSNWAFDWLDASAKPRAGIKIGALTWPGSYDQCLNISTTSSGLPLNTTQSFKGRYCNMMVPVPFQINTTMRIGFNFGICVPNSCSTNEIVDMVNKSLSGISVQLDPVASYCHESPHNTQKDAWYWIAIVLCGSILVIIAVASGVEFLLWGCYETAQLLKTRQEDFNEFETSTKTDESKLNEEITVSFSPSNDREDVPVESGKMHEQSYLEYRNALLSKSPAVLSILLAYSLPFNAWKLWASPPPQIKSPDGTMQPHPLAPLDGIRFITMCWIIFGHLLTFPAMFTNNLLSYIENVKHDWTFQVIYNATVSVDTFFFMSGLLTCYLTLPLLRKVKTVPQQVKFWAIYVAHRFVRLTPAYFLLMIAYIGLYMHLTDGPFYPQNPALTDLAFCHQHWWVTYLNNLIYPKEMCMGWTWYLANDMQFNLVLAPIFLTLLIKYRPVGVAFLILLPLTSTAATFAIAYVNSVSLLTVIDAFDSIYVKPYTRCGTYAIGMMLGWILHDYPKPRLVRSIRGRVIVAVVGLSIATFLCLITMYGTYGVVSGDLPPLDIATTSAFTSFVRLGFITGVAIVVYLCTLGAAGPIRAFLTWSIFRVPARLTYGAYLIHPIIINYYVHSRKEVFMIDNLILIVSFFGILTLSYAGAFIISMAAEAPVLAIERYLRQPRRAKL